MLFNLSIAPQLIFPTPYSLGIQSLLPFPFFFILDPKIDLQSTPLHFLDFFQLSISLYIITLTKTKQNKKTTNSKWAQLSNLSTPTPVELIDTKEKKNLNILASL